MYRLIVLALLLWASLAQASMVIDRAVVNFPVDEPPRQDVTVTNPDQDPLYIDVQVLKVTHPGTDNEKRTVVKDPQKIGFIATPRRLMVPPGGRRIVRLVNLNGHTNQEQVYRVNLKPMAGPVKSKTMGVRVLVGYQLLAFVAPQTSQMKLEGDRNGKKLTLHNVGNVNVQVYQGKQCPLAPQTGDCKKVNARRLYPGNTVTLDLPYDAPVNFTVAGAGKTVHRTFR